MFAFTEIFSKKFDIINSSLLLNGLITRYDAKKVTVPINKGKIILSVGRIAPQKGHDILISIFQKVAQKYPDWKLRIVGAVEDKEYLALLIKKWFFTLSCG